jgi:hypothetical protein
MMMRIVAITARSDNNELFLALVVCGARALLYQKTARKVWTDVGGAGLVLVGGAMSAITQTFVLDVGYPPNQTITQSCVGSSDGSTGR